MGKRVTLTKEDLQLIEDLVRPVLKDGGDYATSGVIGKNHVKNLLNKLGIELPKS